MQHRCRRRHQQHRCQQQQQTVVEMTGDAVCVYWRPVSHYRIAPRKVFLGRQFTAKNPPRPAAARSRRIFTGKLSAGGDFFVGDPIMGRLFMKPAIF